ncbi:hypothetical protein QTJ16_000575 [Diplocarpon rosae]|uniref:Uncharacterized protein n=1 Tax=Diplocarpon rosae TaxID=946125 RepID=A0AAD9T5J5_9HELO|nr:hypothetical protein QTJ16_000575 [Diplocarpon rosae]
MERALQSKSKRNLVADQGESEGPQKRIKVSASQDDRPELAAKSAGSSALTPTPTPADTLRESGSRESQHIIQADHIHRHQEQEPEQLLLSTPALVSIPAEIRELLDNKDEQRILTQYFAINKPKKTPAKTSAFSGLIPSADFISGRISKGVQAANQLLIPAASTRSATQSDSKGEQDEEEDFRRPSSSKLTIELAPVEQRYQLASLYSPPTQGRGSTSQTFDTAVTPQPSHVHTHMDAEDEAEAEDDTKVKQEDLSADEASARLRAAIAGFHSPPPSPSPVRALAPKSPSPGPAPYRRLAYLATPASHDDAEGPQLQEAAHDQLWEGEDEEEEEEEEEEDEEEEGRQASRGASESLFLPLEVKSKTPAKSKSSAARHPTMYHDIIKIEDDDEEEEQEDEIQIISSRDWARSVARKRSGTRK